MEGIDVDKEQKEKKIVFLQIKIGLPDFKNIEKMNRLRLKSFHAEEKVI